MKFIVYEHVALTVTCIRASIEVLKKYTGSHPLHLSVINYIKVPCNGAGAVMFSTEIYYTVKVKVVQLFLKHLETILQYSNPNGFIIFSTLFPKFLELD